MSDPRPAKHIEHADRVVFLGECGPRGKHGDVLTARRTFAVVHFDIAGPLLCLSDDLHRIPRRPKPDF